MARYSRYGERLMQNLDRAAWTEHDWIVVGVRRRKTDPFRALGQELAIADQDEARGQTLADLPLREHRQKLGPDSRGFAASYGDRRGTFHRTMLTLASSPKISTLISGDAWTTNDPSPLASIDACANPVSVAIGLPKIHSASSGAAPSISPVC